MNDSQLSSSHIFKTRVPINELNKFLNTNCIVNDSEYYIFSIESYKRSIFNDTLHSFIEVCKPHYHVSKLHYLTKKQTYKSFLTIIRQLCNINNIEFKTIMTYIKSTYDIIYHIKKELIN